MARKKEDLVIKDEVVRCPEYGSTHIVRDYQRGELICEDCGMVIEDNYIDLEQNGGPSTWNILREERGPALP